MSNYKMVFDDTLVVEKTSARERLESSFALLDSPLPDIILEATEDIIRTPDYQIRVYRNFLSSYKNSGSLRQKMVATMLLANIS